MQMYMINNLSVEIVLTDSTVNNTHMLTELTQVDIVTQTVDSFALR